MNTISQNISEILSVKDVENLPVILGELGTKIIDLIHQVKKEKLSDRFFMEEAIFRNIKSWDNAEDYTNILLHDWLSEMVKNNPLTEDDRQKYLKNVLGWDADFCKSAYFKSEKQLAYYLSTKRLLTDKQIDVANENYSIIDKSIKNEI